MTAVPYLSTGCAGRRARGLVRGLATGAVLLSLVALAIGFGYAQGAAGRGSGWMIVLIHVPAAWLSLALYGAAVVAAGAGMLAPERLVPRPLAAIAPVGAAAAFVALWTGLTSQQVRGAWWGWDARLVCELVLLALYGGAMVLLAVVEDPLRAERAAAVFVLVGALNIPAIYFSVNWWHTLHERAAASVGRSPVAIAAMAVMTLAFCLSAAALVLARLQSGAPKEQR